VIYWLAVLTTLAVTFHLFEDDSLPPSSEWDKYFLIGDVLLVIAVLMSLAVAVSAWRIWRRPATSRVSQIKFTLVAFACLYFSWFAIHWHAITPVHRF
jgi:phosphoglycerol transferase MdoB-like AlkP superfamily enzyme